MLALLGLLELCEGIKERNAMPDMYAALKARHEALLYENQACHADKEELRHLLAEALDRMDRKVYDADLAARIVAALG